MNTKSQGIKYVILNVYGGESLYHPEIVEILRQVKVKHQPYVDKWHLTITTTTNGIVSDKKLQQIIPLIDEFTMSYHTESTSKQKQQFQKNLLAIAQAGRRQKCMVLMHERSDLFDDANNMISWLTKNNIRVLPKQLDGNHGTNNKRIYNQQQVQWFDNLYQSKTFGCSTDLLDGKNETSLTDVGRACCGGRQLCTNENYKQRHFYLENKFPDWYCSVNHFFLYVKQVTKEIFVNKDCKMNFNNTVGPIGLLSESQKLLDATRKQLETGIQPIIQCKKYKCNCGLCAPKAKNLEDYKSIMKKYQKEKT
jgi:hypothetical protein